MDQIHLFVNHQVKIITAEKRVIRGHLVAVDQVANCVLKDVTMDAIEMEAYYVRGDSIAVLGK